MDQPNERTHAEKATVERKGMRRRETRLLEWPSKGPPQGLYRSMMIFEQGVPGFEVIEDPGMPGAGRGKVLEVRNTRESITVVVAPLSRPRHALPSVWGASMSRATLLGVAHICW